jgi:hypothetical protein
VPPRPRPVLAWNGSSPRRISRRRAIAGIGVLGLAASGCTPYTVDEPVLSRPTPPAARGTDPDVTLAATVLAQEEEMLARVDAALARHRTLRRTLTDARSAHLQHVRLLTDAVPSPPPTPLPAGRVHVDRTPDKALAALARHEDELSLVGKRSAFAAESGAFARALASMAASAAQQAVVMRERAATVRSRS